MRNLLQDSVERLLADAVTPEMLHAAEAGIWPVDLWADVEALGLPLAGVSEDFGGTGARWTEIFVVIRACGRTAAPLPLPEAIFANSLLATAGLQPPENGPIVFASGSHGDALKAIPWGRHAPWLVLHEPARGLIGLHSLADAEIIPGVNIAGEPRDTIRLATGSLQAEAAFGGDVDAIRAGGAMLRSAQIAGALERLTDMSATYANERIQFGRAIGKFQAVQQQLAVLATQAAAAGAAAETAFLRADAAFDSLAPAAAKAVASEAAAKAAEIAHAIHGALGFTHEHNLHFLTRRLWAWRDEYGSDAFWADHLGRTLAPLGAAGLWPRITAVLPETTAP